ncbi:hypothetical protein LXL04_008779 [Taraxacum kok-saghyz]
MVKRRNKKICVSSPIVEDMDGNDANWVGRGLEEQKRSLGCEPAHNRDIHKQQMWMMTPSFTKFLEVMTEKEELAEKNAELAQMKKLVTTQKEQNEELKKHKDAS